MNMLFQIQSPQLLIFCMDDQEIVASLDYVYFVLCFTALMMLSNHLIILLHLISFFPFTRSLIVPYASVSIKSIDCFLLSSFELNGNLLISSVRTLCLSLLNNYWVFNIDLLFLMNSLLFFSIQSLLILFLSR